MRPPGHSGKAKRGHLCFDSSFETGKKCTTMQCRKSDSDIFLLLRFYVKSDIANSKGPHMVILTISSALNFKFDEILQFLRDEI